LLQNIPFERESIKFDMLNFVTTMPFKRENITFDIIRLKRPLEIPTLASSGGRKIRRSAGKEHSRREKNGRL
jgi:hypothetical protein